MRARNHLKTRSTVEMVPPATAEEIDLHFVHTQRQPQCAQRNISWTHVPPIYKRLKAMLQEYQ